MFFDSHDVIELNEPDERLRRPSWLLTQSALQEPIMPESTSYKQCSKCKETKPVEEFYFFVRSRDGLRSQCKMCHISYTVHYRPELYQRNKKKCLARSYFHWLVKSGKIIKPEICEQCGSSDKLEAHHHKGYTKEFVRDVRWLCRFCHRQEEFISRLQQSNTARSI
jgi:hypothetical protein